MRFHLLPFAVGASLLIVALCACASSSPKDATPANETDALAGCVLHVGPSALCDDGKTILDTANVKAPTPEERIELVFTATDRPDDQFQTEGRDPVRAADGSVTRVALVHPRNAETATVGTITFTASATGDAVVSCASFGKGDARCAERSRALLGVTPPAQQALQHQPTVTLPDVDGCEWTNEPIAKQRMCKDGTKLSIVGIKGRFGPAAGWWMFHRVVQSAAKQMRAVTSCRALGQHGVCALTTVPDEKLGERPALFGLSIERDELRISACFFPGEVGAIPVGCHPALAAEPAQLKIIESFDALWPCRLMQANEDTFARAVVCDDGSSIATFAHGEKRNDAHGESIACKVRGAPAKCTKTTSDGATTWRADVVDPRVASFACTAKAPTFPEVCRGFIEAADAP